MSNLPENILVDGLDALDQGEPIGEILSRYMDYADELRPILETAVRISVLNLQPTVEAQTKSREAFLRQAEVMKGGDGRRRGRPLFLLLLRPFAAMALLVVLAIGFASVSARSLPGDVLYGAKLFIEGAQLSLSGGNGQIEERNRQNRILEIEALLAQGREANVSFRGMVDGVEADVWRIEGLLVSAAAAGLSGNPAVGDVVDVQGWVADGRLVANTITVVQKNENPPTPEPTATPSPTETAVPTETPTATFTPAPTETPTETMIVDATVTAVPATTTAPTSSPTPTSTATPLITVELPTATNTPVPLPQATADDDDDGDDDNDDDDDDDDNDDDDDDDNSGSGSSNSGSGSSNSGSGSSNSGSNDDDDDKD
ncbi:MAG: hypothetical protein H6658_08715 [Ardenticatenaceae bacterium]|nr:hypothetical protein [Ardenticatenaceae bacterium]